MSLGQHVYYYYSLFIMGSFTPKSPPFGVKIIFNQFKIVLEKNEV